MASVGASSAARMLVRGRHVAATHKPTTNPYSAAKDSSSSSRGGGSSSSSPRTSGSLVSVSTPTMTTSVQGNMNHPPAVTAGGSAAAAAAAALTAATSVLVTVAVLYFGGPRERIMDPLDGDGTRDAKERRDGEPDHRARGAERYEALPTRPPPLCSRPPEPASYSLSSPPARRPLAFRTSAPTSNWLRSFVVPLLGGGGGGVVAARCEEREDSDGEDFSRSPDNSNHNNDNSNDDEPLHRFEARYPTGYTEPERFAQALEYHRSLLFDYLRRWEMATNHHQPTEQPRSRNHHPQHHYQKKNGHKVTAPENQGIAAETGGATIRLGPVPPSSSSSSSSSSGAAWPRHVPDAQDVPALEFDLQFCRKQRRRKRRSRTSPPPPQGRDHPSGSTSLPYLAASSPAGRGRREPDAADPPASSDAANDDAAAPTSIRDVCQNVEFRVASYYLSRAGRPDDLNRGYRMVKELAEQGHPDGMCLYGMILMDGPDRVPGVRRRPEEAVRWLQRSATLHRHIAATYELGVAHYTGEGTSAMDPGHAIRLFQQAAHLGHSGAAYMLGECLLDGVGCDRDRASALEWLLTAAELGHGLARERALMVLLEDHAQLVREAMSTEHVEVGRRNEALKWLEGRDEEVVINLERRHTIGGSGIKVPSRIAAVRERRLSKVRESRDEGNQLYHPPAAASAAEPDGLPTDGPAAHEAES